MTLDVASTRLTLDPRGLEGLKREVRTDADSPEALRAVAKQFEGLFAQMLIKSMRAASFGEGLMDSEQSEFYRDIFDQQLAAELSEGPGLGLAEMLFRQLSQGTPADASTPATGAAAPAATAAPAADATPAATTSGASPASREAFVRELWPHAERAGRVLGVDPSTIVSHAALETGWGRALPRRDDGQSSHNVFGIKAAGAWQGGAAAASTLEYRDGAMQRGVERFRAYGSLAEGVDDYARLIGRAGRYADARGTGSDAAAFAQALQRGGYATDPAYATKLQAVAEQVRSLARGQDPLKVAADRPMTVATRRAT